MRSLKKISLFGCSIAIAIIGVGAAQEKVADVAGLIGQLSDIAFSQRQAAMRDLAGLGLAAIPSLTTALCDPNPETRWRAAKTLEDIGLNGDERTMRKVTRIMHLLGSKGVAGLVEKSLHMRALWLESQVERISNRLMELGAIVEINQGSEMPFAEGLVFRDGVLVEDLAERPNIRLDNSQPAPAREEQDWVDVKQSIDEILAADDADDDEALAELKPHVESKSTEVDADNDEVIDLFGGVSIDPFESQSASHRTVSLGEKWKGTEEDFELLLRVSRLNRLNFASCSISTKQWETAAEITSLRYLYVTRCEYDSADGLEFRSKRPEVYVRVVGRGFLGVMGPQNGSDESCVISQVLPNTGADKAGLAVDDKVVAINDVPVNAFQDLIIIVGSLNVGDEIELTYRRDGKSHKTTAILQERNLLDQ